MAGYLKCFSLAPGFWPQLAFVHIAIVIAVAAVYAHIMPVALALGGVFDHDGAVGDALLYFGTLVGIQAQVGRAVGAVHGINMAQANLALVHIAADDALPLRLGWL